VKLCGGKKVPETKQNSLPLSQRQKKIEKNKGHERNIKRVDRQLGRAGQKKRGGTHQHPVGKYQILKESAVKESGGKSFPQAEGGPLVSWVQGGTTPQKKRKSRTFEKEKLKKGREGEKKRMEGRGEKAWKTANKWGRQKC